MKGIVIRTNGIAEVVDFPQGDVGEKLKWYYSLLGCDCIDIVHPYGLEEAAKKLDLKAYLRGFSMVVDDEALLKDKPEVNVIASLLYGVDSHGQPLCGDVLVAKDQETEDGIETVGMTDKEVTMLHVAINCLIAMHNDKVRGGA